MIIPVAHDYSCPWCWIGLFQAERLRAEFGVTFDWLGYEIFPEGLEYIASPKAEEPPDKPPVPTRLQLAYAAQGMDRPTVTRPWPMNTHAAHEATEFAKTEGRADELVGALYHAHYEEGANLEDVDVLVAIAKPILSDMDGMLKAIYEKRYKDKIVGFDEGAYRTGIYNVPTFYIGGERYAEQPYVVLQRAMQKAMVSA